jgi:hypothetical protein
MTSSSRAALAAADQIAAERTRWLAKRGRRAARARALRAVWFVRVYFLSRTPIDVCVCMMDREACEPSL